MDIGDEVYSITSLPDIAGWLQYRKVNGRIIAIGEKWISVWGEVESIWYPFNRIMWLNKDYVYVDKKLRDKAFIDLE